MENASEKGGEKKWKLNKYGDSFILFYFFALILFLKKLNNCLETTTCCVAGGIFVCRAEKGVEISRLAQPANLGWLWLGWQWFGGPWASTMKRRRFILFKFVTSPLAIFFRSVGNYSI